MGLRRLGACLLVLGCALAVCQATDVSFPKPLTDRLTCVLPISYLKCARDWRSGFVSGVQYDWASAEGGTEIDGKKFWHKVCAASSSATQNQTGWDMSEPSAIDKMNDGSPEWLRVDNPSPYLYPFNSPITQVIVLEAKNPWGELYGNIPAILFGYLKTDGKLDFAVCGNAQYAQFYLNPAESDPPPTPVTLKAVYTSPLTDDGELTALGGFTGVCANRAGFLGGDPRTRSLFSLKALKNVCFTPWDWIKAFEPSSKDPPKRIEGDFHCNDDDHTHTDGDGHDHEHDKDRRCFQPCHYDKKNAKKSTSFSCAMHGTAIATGKYGAIVFDKDGYQYDWDKDEEGNYQQVFYNGGEKGLAKGTDPEEPTLPSSGGRPAALTNDDLAAAKSVAAGSTKAAAAAAAPAAAAAAKKAEPAKPAAAPQKS